MILILFLLLLPDCLFAKSFLKVKETPLSTLILDLSQPVHPHQIQNLLSQIKSKNPKPSWSVIPYAVNQTRHSEFEGGVFDPLNQKIIFIPGSFNAAPLERYNCRTGEIETYTHPFGNVGGSRYYGGVFDPHNLRIIFIPHCTQNSGQWHYYDCITQQIVAYNHGTSLTNSNCYYRGGVFDPVNQRIVFAPSHVNNTSTWHYYDCLETTPTIRSYTHNNPTPVSYNGGAYDPRLRRIIFAPHGIYGGLNFQYYDCLAQTEENRIGSYTHGVVDVGVHFRDWPYQGAVWDPINYRVVFVPSGQITRPYWDYYDSLTENLGFYSHGTSPAGSYRGGVFDPILRKIFFIPSHSDGVWHYYDCDSQSVSTYTGVNAAGYYGGGVYDPLGNQILMIPYNRVQTQWEAIKNSGSQSSHIYSLMSHYIFNQF